MVNLHDKIIKRAEDIPLSDEDLANITGGQTRVVDYEELKGFNSIFEAFESTPTGDNFILFYRFPETEIGHYITVILDKENRTIRHFDSYGLKPDEELHTTGFGEYSRLLNKANQDGWLLDINREKLQRLKEHVNTCGRWASLRVVFREMDNQTFAQLFKINKIETPDDIVTSMTLLFTLNKL